MATNSGSNRTLRISRMAKLRERRRAAGALQVTAHLTVEASALFRQMVEFSKKSQGKLLSDAISGLAWDYEYWRVRKPSWWDDKYDDGPESSHYKNWRGWYEENPNFDDRPVPPWIVEDERLAAAEERAREEARAARPKDDDDEFSVYRRGVRVTGDTKKRLVTEIQRVCRSLDRA
jgi:hypothetical protein